jgi:hypothetical protein
MIEAPAGTLSAAQQIAVPQALFTSHTGTGNDYRVGQPASPAVAPV